MRVATLVWERFGDAPNYVEPFFGSGAVKADPGAVAALCDWPVNEADMHARHRWLIERVEFRQRMRADPDFFDAQIAAWWCWGLSAWIGSGWCQEAREQLPELGGTRTHGRGVHAKGTRKALFALFDQLSNRLRYTRVACGDWTRVLTDSVTWRHGTTAVFLDPPWARASAER